MNLKRLVLITLLAMVGLALLTKTTYPYSEEKINKNETITNVRKVFIHFPGHAYSFLFAKEDNSLDLRVIRCFDGFHPQIKMFMDVPQSNKMWARYNIIYEESYPGRSQNNYCEIEFHVHSEEDIETGGDLFMPHSRGKVIY